MTNPEIPEEAARVIATAFAQAQASMAWDTYSDETRALLVDSALPTARHSLRSALPHLRVQETPVLDLTDAEVAGLNEQIADIAWVQAASTGEAEYVLREFESLMRDRLTAKGEIKTRAELNLAVLASLRDEARMNGAAPHPRPVVDREAVIKALSKKRCVQREDGEDGSWDFPTYDEALQIAEAVLALLPTEEEEGS